MIQLLRTVRVPLIFKLLIPLIFGVIVTFYGSPNIPVELVLILFFTLVVLAVPFVSKQFLTRHFFGVVSSVLFFFLGILLTEIQISRLHADYFMRVETNDNHNYQLQLTTVPETKTNSIKCFAEVRAVDGQKKMGKTLLYFQKDERANGLKYGDIIYANIRFNPVRANGNPKEFDYARYLRIHDVTHQAYLQNETWQRVGSHPNLFLNWVYGVRSSLDDLLEKSGLEGANLMVARALILGEKESLDRETLRTYSSAGAMHVLAVSGLHVGIVMLIFSALLKPVKRLPKGIILYVFFLLVIIWLYALITGMSSSVLRASVMFSFVIIGKELERETSIYQSIMVSAFILILIEPLVIFQVGFQLSYLAVLGIVFLQPKIYNLLYVKYLLVDKVWQITSVSLAAQMATFPLGLYYFHQFPNFFMISNLIVIPLAFAILIVGISFFITQWIPILGDIVFWVLDFLLTVLNHGVKWVENLPYSIYWGVSIHWFEVFWLYLIILLATGAFILRKPKLVLATLVLSCGLLVFNIWEKWVIENSNQLVIYSVNKSIAIDVFYGGKNIFIADEELLADEDKLLFHIKHNWFFRSGNEQPFKALPYQADKGLIRFGNETLLILDTEKRTLIPKSSLVFVQNTKYVDTAIMDDWVERNVPVIVGDGVGYNLITLLNQKLGEGQVHELDKEGAFVRSFD